MQLSDDHHHHIKLKQKKKKRRKLQHLCLDKACNSEPEEQELIKRGYMYCILLCCITLKFVFYDRTFVKIIRISNGWYIKLKPNMSYSYEKIELCNKALHITSKKKEMKKKNKATTKHCSNRKKYSAKRWVVERTNSWHNRFRKLFTRYEKKVENYLGLYSYSVT